MASFIIGMAIGFSIGFFAHAILVVSKEPP
jgi:hypothetical protein